MNQIRFQFAHSRTVLILGALLLQTLFVIGCLPFVGLSSTTVTNLSRKPPYKSFVGKFVVAKESGSIWNNTVRLGTGDDIPSYRTDLKKVAEFPIGTKIKIHSIKQTKMTSEMGCSDSIQASCTVFLQDGRKINGQLNWDLLNPDPRVWPTLKFELLDH